MCKAVSRLHHCQTPIIHRDLKVSKIYNGQYKKLTIFFIFWGTYIMIRLHTVSYKNEQLPYIKNTFSKHTLANSTLQLTRSDLWTVLQIISRQWRIQFAFVIFIVSNIKKSHKILRKQNCAFCSKLKAHSHQCWFHSGRCRHRVRNFSISAGEHNHSLRNLQTAAFSVNQR